MEKQIKIITLNPNREDLTPDKLKSFTGFEKLSEEEASDTVFAIQTIANVLYEFINEQSKPNQLKSAA